MGQQSSKRQALAKHLAADIGDSLLKSSDEEWAFYWFRSTIWGATVEKTGDLGSHDWLSQLDQFRRAKAKTRPLPTVRDYIDCVDSYWRRWPPPPEYCEATGKVGLPKWYRNPPQQMPSFEECCQAAQSAATWRQAKIFLEQAKAIIDRALKAESFDELKDITSEPPAKKRRVAVIWAFMLYSYTNLKWAEIHDRVCRDSHTFQSENIAADAKEHCIESLCAGVRELRSVLRAAELDSCFPRFRKKTILKPKQNK